MPKATGAQTDIAYVAEATWGVTPAAPTMKEFRVKGEGLNLTRTTLASEQISSHRQIENVILGMHAVAGAGECEFGDYLDDWLEAALFGSFISGVLKLGSVRKFFTVERRLHDLHRVMQYTGVMANGLTLSLEPDSIAQITFNLMGKTLGLDTDSLGGPNGWLINEPATPPAATDTSFDIDAGTTDPAVDDTFMVYQDGTPDSPRSQQVYTVTAYAAPLLTFTPPLDVALLDNDILHFIRPSTAVTASDPMNSFGGAITEGGSALGCVVTSINLEIAHGLTPAEAIGSIQACDLIEGQVVVTGTLSVYVEDFVLFSKWLNGTYTSLQLTLTDGTTTYTWLLPRIKYTGGTINKDVSGDPIIQGLPFQAVWDATELTSVKITKA